MYVCTLYCYCQSRSNMTISNKQHQQNNIVTPQQETTQSIYRLRVPTCRLLTHFPDSVAIVTSKAVTIISTTVVHVAIQREWNCTASRRDS